MIVVIDYQMGNPGSIINMLKRIGVKAELSNNVDVIQNAEKLILPGVGSFDEGMRKLQSLGLVSVLNEAVLKHRKPILGICLGMQLMGVASDEGSLPGLSWLKFRNIKFKLDESNTLKVPHMGWNTVTINKEHPVLRDSDDQPRYYFVHSYHAVCENKQDILLESDYGYTFVAAVANENVCGVQFHPEKSHRFGMKLLKNYVEW